MPKTRYEPQTIFALEDDDNDYPESSQAGPSQPRKASPPLPGYSSRPPQPSSQGYDDPIDSGRVGSSGGSGAARGVEMNEEAPLTGGGVKASRGGEEGIEMNDGYMDGDGDVSGTGEGTEGGVTYATPAQRRAIWWKNVIITGGFILSWYTFATLLSVYNKWMFSPEYYGFSFPLFTTFWQMVIQWILASIIRATLPQYRPAARPSRQDYVSKILPTAIATGGDIGLSNLSLKTITLSLYTMCKSSSLIFVLLFAFLFHLETFSLRLVSVISLISFGVFLMVFNTTSVSIPGILMVFGASAIGGFRWALTSLLMHTQRMGMTNPFATIYWLAPIMAVTLAIVSLIFESWSEIFGNGHFEGIKAFTTIGYIALPGAIAFSMVASEYFIIQRAGVVPLSIAGIFKEVTTITISAWVFGDKLTQLNIIGVIITVIGIALYSYHKYQKTVNSPVPLDSHGNPIQDLDHDSAVQEQHRIPTITLNTDYRPIQDGEDDVSPITAKNSLPLGTLHHTPATDTISTSHPYPPPQRGIEDPEDRKQKLRDDFEGWGEFDEDEEDDDDDGKTSPGDQDEEDREVLRRRSERDSGRSGVGVGVGAMGKSWGSWWDREM